MIIGAHAIICSTDPEADRVYLRDVVGLAGAACDPVQSLGRGRLTRVSLPGGGRLGVYEPRHARPGSPAVRAGEGRTGSRPQGGLHVPNPAILMTGVGKT